MPNTPILNEQTFPTLVPANLAVTTLTVGGKTISGSVGPTAITPGVNMSAGTPAASTMVESNGTRAFAEGQLVFGAGGVLAGAVIGTVASKPLSAIRELNRLQGSGTTTFVLIDAAAGNITLSANANAADTLNLDGMNWRIA